MWGIGKGNIVGGIEFWRSQNLTSATCEKAPSNCVSCSFMKGRERERERERENLIVNMGLYF